MALPRLKPECCRATVPSGAFGGEPISLLFPLSGSHTHPSAHDPLSPSSKPAVLGPVLLPLPSLSSVFMNHCDYLGSPQRLQEILPYFKDRWLPILIPSNTLSPLCHVNWHTYRFWVLGHGHLWWGRCQALFCLPHCPNTQEVRALLSLIGLLLSMTHRMLELHVCLDVIGLTHSIIYCSIIYNNGRLGVP